MGTSFQSGKLNEFGTYLESLTSTYQDDTELAAICQSASLDQADLMQLLDDLAIAYCWLGMIQSEVDDTKAAGHFRTALALWSELIQQLDPSQEPSAHAPRFKSVEATLHSLSMSFLWYLLIFQEL